MYEAITEGIWVRVTPQFIDDRSSPDDNDYFWSYTVEITNDGAVPVQLLTRAWHITDGNGKKDVVKGPGVVGQTPLIPPGQSFTYTSGCQLSTPSGIMLGSYQMQRHDGSMLDVKIPPFSLDSPFEGRRVN